MKLAELKQEVYECWTRLSTYRDALVQPENFQSEVRNCGDLRYKKTWQKAYASFYAKIAWESGITEYTAIAHVFNFTSERWDYELRYEIIEQFFSIPGAWEFIVRGLEEIYYQGNGEDQECANEFLALAEAKQGRGKNFTARPVRRLSGVEQLQAS